MASRQEKNQIKQEKIDQEEKNTKNKKRVILVVKILFLIAVIFFGAYFYTKYSSTTGIIVKEERIINKKIPDSFEGIKIIQFSDLYYGSTIFSEEVDKIIKIINVRKPDIILFSGNLIDPNYKISTKEKNKLIESLQKLNANIGKYAVSGNKDNEEFNAIMNQSDFNILDNNYDLIYSNDNSSILLVGLSSLVNEKRDVDKAYSYFKEETHNSNIYTVSLMSETDDLDNILSTYNTDLVLAGNSLNGQINLFGHSLISKEGSKKYTEKYYKINNTKLYVSSGIGSPDLGIRLFARPSINFFRISNK